MFNGVEFCQDLFLFCLLSYNLLQIQMEAQLRMKMQYDSRMINQGERPYINVLPNYPFQAYKRFDQETLVNIKKTQRVPLPQLRQLILLYILEEKPRVFMQQSSLLTMKLSKRQLEQVNRNLNDMSDRIVKEEQRINKLSQVLKQYHQYRQQLISRNVMKSMHNIHEEAERFKNAVRMIQQQKNNKINDFMSRVRNDRFRLQGSSVQINQQLNQKQQQELSFIQKQANTKILNYLRSQDQLNETYEADQQSRLRGLRFLGNYLNEFEKALIFIVSEKHISNINQLDDVANQNYYKTFGDRLELYKNKVNKLKIELLNYIFDWKMNVKFDRDYQSKHEQFIFKSNELAKQMETELYYYIPNILMNIQKDREDLRNITDFFTKNYENYLGTYYSIKEVQLYHSKQSHIEDVIQNERYSLNSHLKKNFGMMVPYKKSAEYEELSSLAISREKPYLKSLMEQKISFLEQSIAYINYQHSNLYKQACSNSPGIAIKIKRKLDEFQRLGTRSPQIKAHLQQSCQRLLQIINH